MFHLVMHMSDLKYTVISAAERSHQHSPAISNQIIDLILSGILLWNLPRFMASSLLSKGIWIHLEQSVEI